jgi:hypothetical protein
MREPRHCQPPVPSIANEASSAEHDLHPESTCESSRPLREPAPINPDPRDQHLAVNMEEERLWKFRKPEWLNSVWARNAGVYAAGAIVRWSREA